MFCTLNKLEVMKGKKKDTQVLFWVRETLQTNDHYH